MKEIIKKFILLLLGIFVTIMCLFGVFALFIILYFADFQEGKAVVIIVFLMLIILFGWIAFKCYKAVFCRKKDIQTQQDVKAEIKTNPQKLEDEQETIAASHVELENPNEPQVKHVTGYVKSEPSDKVTIQPTTILNSTPDGAILSPVIKVGTIPQEVPQEILSDMRLSYTGNQAVNDIRIINESLEIMEKTSDIDTFLSRYELAMKCALTLEQAKKAGIPIALPNGYSTSLSKAKDKALVGALYRSFQKELDEINKLKTERGKINRINTYQEKLNKMYEDVFEFVAEDAFNDVMQKLDYIKSNQ